MIANGQFKAATREKDFKNYLRMEHCYKLRDKKIPPRDKLHKFCEGSCKEERDFQPRENSNQGPNLKLKELETNAKTN